MNNVFFTLGNASYQLEAIAFAEYQPPVKDHKNSAMLVLHMVSGEKTNLFGEKAEQLWGAIQSSSLVIY